MEIRKLSLKVGAAIPGAPLGILGGFIEKKLAEYVEPARAGTPKGERIGLSRKKFHAALLSLTSLDLRKQAKQVHVSYGVLRKWRTEDAFLDCTLQLSRDFIDGTFLEAAELSMDLHLNSEITIKAAPSVELDTASVKRRLPGFEDARLYSPLLVSLIQEHWLKEAKEAAETGKMVFRCLAWARPLGRLYREAIADSEGELRRRHVAFLASLQRRVLLHPTGDRGYIIDAASTIAELIHEVMND